jgi:hypothetical protein
LNISTDGTIYLAYPRGQGADGNLILAKNSSGTFTSSTLYSGTNANLPGTPAVNFGVAGWGISSTLNTAAYFTSVYLGPGNWLYSTSCGD